MKFSTESIGSNGLKVYGEIEAESLERAQEIAAGLGDKLLGRTILEVGDESDDETDAHKRKLVESYLDNVGISYHFMHGTVIPKGKYEIHLFWYRIQFTVIVVQLSPGMNEIYICANDTGEDAIAMIRESALGNLKPFVPPEASS